MLFDIVDQLDSIPETWTLIEFDSEAGKWYLAANATSYAKYSSWRNQAEPMAVFSRDEFIAIRDLLKELNQIDRMVVLRDMIAVKLGLEGARLAGYQSEKTKRAAEANRRTEESRNAASTGAHRNRMRRTKGASAIQK